MSSENLTAEQKKFLEECEIEFADRYTQEDEDYAKIYKTDIPPPPIMSPWYGRTKLIARRRGPGGSNHNNYRDYRDESEHHRSYRDRGNYYNRNSDRRYTPY